MNLLLYKVDIVVKFTNSLFDENEVSRGLSIFSRGLSPSFSFLQFHSLSRVQKRLWRLGMIVLPKSNSFPYIHFRSRGGRSFLNFLGLFSEVTNGDNFLLDLS